jgi:hypothetical protein
MLESEPRPRSWRAAFFCVPGAYRWPVASALALNPPAGQFLRGVRSRRPRRSCGAGGLVPVAWTSAPIDRTGDPVLPSRAPSGQGVGDGLADRLQGGLINPPPQGAGRSPTQVQQRACRLGRIRAPIRGRTAAPRPMRRLARRRCGSESRRSTPGRPSPQPFAFETSRKKNPLLLDFRVRFRAAIANGRARMHGGPMKSRRQG